MVDRCDACGARALTWWARVDGDTSPELYLCGHHDTRHADALTRAEWVQVADERDSLVPG